MKTYPDNLLDESFILRYIKNFSTILQKTSFYQSKFLPLESILVFPLRFITGEPCDTHHGIRHRVPWVYFELGQSAFSFLCSKCIKLSPTHSQGQHSNCLWTIENTLTPACICFAEYKNHENLNLIFNYAYICVNSCLLSCI